jgi:homoserine kinase type II
MLERLASVDEELGNRERRGVSVEALPKDVSWIRSKLQHYLRLRDSSLPSGIIHGDLFRDNVLWANGAIASLLDFESASRGTFVYDLMVCIEAWCFTERFETARVAALLSGYQRKRPLSPAEIQALETEGALVALRFATTRITDFSLRAAPGEKPKRDYRRFIERLSQIEAGALREAISR